MSDGNVSAREEVPGKRRVEDRKGDLPTSPATDNEKQIGGSNTACYKQIPYHKRTLTAGAKRASSSSDKTSVVGVNLLTPSFQ